MGQKISTPHEVRFIVDDVTPATTPLPKIPIKEAMERTLKTRVMSCPRSDEMVVEGGDFHPLIAAAALAYKQHYPLVLSPDMIWLTVLQGLAQHINNNAEALRSRLVHHHTKIELFVDTNLNGLPSEGPQMLGLANEFAAQIARHIQPGKRFLMETQFSTTGEIERIVECIVLMDAFQPYFDYVFAVICGIPSIVLEGTPADWELLKARVHALHESDLDVSGWTKHLLPLCDHFVGAASGDVDARHWKDICKLTSSYGADDLNGWILKFIPYVRKDKNETPVHRNPVLELTDYSRREGDLRLITGCTSDMLPTGLSSAPVTCVYKQDGQKEEVQFIGGFTGVVQSAEDLSLRPAIGWAIAEGHKIDTLIKRLLVEHEFHPPKGLSMEELTDKFGGYLPGDLWRFYTQTDGCSISFKKPNQWGESRIGILSLDFVRKIWDSDSVEGELLSLRKRNVINEAVYEDRKEFNFPHSQLIRIAQAHVNQGYAYYVFGRDPELFWGTGAVKSSRGEIFRWTGGHHRDAFTPVAHTFTEWLMHVLGHAV